MHKHKSKSKSHRWGAWSEWTWDSTQQANVRVRQDTEEYAEAVLAGHLEYEWEQQDLNPAGHARTPRDAAVEDITERLNSLTTTTNEAHFEVAEEYDYAGGAPEQPKTKKNKPKIKEKEKGKEKSDRRRASSDGKSSTTSPEGAANTECAGLQCMLHLKSVIPVMPHFLTCKDVESSYAKEHRRQNQTVAALPAMSRHAAHAPQAAVNYSQYGSARAAYTSGMKTKASAASSSQAAAEAQLYTEEDFEATSSKIGSQTPNTYDELLLMKAGEAHSGSEGSPTPQPETAADGEYISRTTEGDAGELDPRYRIEHSTRFQPGEIFKVHWSEPQGSISEAPKSSSKKEDLQNKFGTAFFVGFRRFIVVANDQGHCTCVPILTYGGKACKKSGVKPEKHGIVYERGQKSKKLDGEPSLGFSPVRVEMTEEGERISRESRVNYSKLVTVEHNVKVFFIGHVYASDWQIVGDAVNHCWNKKIHQKQRHK
ncbi:hypothetical protein BBO_03759 [Beauveria brongniartii RCEF 3172]|uniref:DUF6590 domain-containing protein n=1 Tax=Beauveria brongniartii RCEF 3172 TaxID=1081107 RepID=A0A167FF06_9HYPO|nr:hypothetical protein BBO_03759 [Beauveria brongniartii RCEF 3172]